MSETRIVGDILDALNRLESVYAWRNNTGTAWIEGRKIKFSEAGAADIFAVYAGRFFALEAKTATGRQSPAQKRWQAKLEAAGAVYGIVRGREQAYALLGILPSHSLRPIRRRIYPR